MNVEWWKIREAKGRVDTNQKNHPPRDANAFFQFRIRILLLYLSQYPEILNYDTPGVITKML